MKPSATNDMLVCALAFADIVDGRGAVDIGRLRTMPKGRLISEWRSREASVKATLDKIVADGFKAGVAAIFESGGFKRSEGST